MLNIYMLVGIPASGKTTLAKKLAANEKTFTYVSRDDVRRKITGTNKINMEKEGQILEEFCLEILKKAEQGYTSIFADATHATPRSRYSFYRKIYSLIENLKLPITDISIIPIVVETPYEICFERNSKRDSSIAAPEEDMKNFYANCLYPSKIDIGFDKVFPVRYFYNPKTDSFFVVDFS